MKVLYLECNMGASGDMLLASLYELLPDQEGFLKAMNRLVPGVSLTAKRAESCGIRGTRAEVRVNEVEEKSELLPGDGSTHGSLHSARARIAALPLPEEVKRNAAAIYESIAEAEAAVHGVPVSEVHFHELGALDALADIVGVSYALYLLAPEKICVSTVSTGFGQVRCAHGILPVPAPATARLLLGLPCRAGEIEGELCTPTGAALLKHFGQSFGPMPTMTMEKLGIGVGQRSFAAANCLRAFWGTDVDETSNAIVELCCNIDDMSAEALAFAGERLMDCGALDVSFAPVTMKKGRPGVVFTVLCAPADEARIAEAVLRETSTNGVRARRCEKYILRPSIETVQTPYGPMRVKCAEGGEISRAKPEYEDVAAAARESGQSFQKVWKDTLLRFYTENNGKEKS